MLCKTDKLAVFQNKNAVLSLGDVKKDHIIVNKSKK